MEEDLLPDEYRSVNLNLQIKAKLDKRISQHIRSLKHLEGKGYSKKRWVQEAIKAKLQSLDLENLENIESDCHLKVTLSGHMDDEIRKTIKILKALNVNYSKTEFVLEAIEEKLNLDEKGTKELLRNMVKNTSKANDPSIN